MLKLKNFAIIMISIILVISPWLIRNYIVLKSFPVFATGSGFSFYRYNNEMTLKVIDTPLRYAFPFTEEQKKTLSVLPESKIDKYLYSLAWQFIKLHPGDFLKIRLNEVNSFWHLWPASTKRFTKYYSQWKQLGLPEHDIFIKHLLNYFKNGYFLYCLKLLYHLPYNILFIGMFVSIAAHFKRDKQRWAKSLLLFLLIITISTIYIFHHGTDRYRMPIDPYVFILGLDGVALCYKNLTRRKK